MRPGGSDWQTYATGLRNPFSLTVGPDGTLWATDNEREDLPPGLPPEELNRIVAGGDYGWPRCYGDRVPDPEGGGNATNCARTMAPVATFPAHWSPVGLAFYTGGRFAPEDNGALFVGMAGVWDRSRDHGRRMVRVRLRDGVERMPRMVGVQDGKPLLQDGGILDVANVIWCTGLASDFRWIDLPVFGSDGYPLHSRGLVKGEPDLYFLGLPFQ